MELTDPVTTVPLIGKRYQELLKRLEIETVEDLLRHYPTRYEDFSATKKISQLIAGERATIKVTVTEIKNIFTRNHKRLTRALAVDDTGTILLVWFNQHYLTNIIHPGESFYFSGALTSFSGQIAFLSPQFEKLAPERQGNQLHTGRLVPIYAETAGLSSKWLRSRIGWVLKNLEKSNTEIEFLPQSVIKKFKLVELDTALKTIHFPQNETEVKLARRRLAFEELFLLQLRAMEQRQNWKKDRHSHKIPSQVYREKLTELLRSLPFQLTPSQERSLEEILQDLEKDQPMNRLLQGDVGSGKTIVAVIASEAVRLAGYQTAYMAPTAILARQHLETFKKFLAARGAHISLQTGGEGNAPRNSDPRPDIIIGTHALLHRPELFRDLALVVIDEQHRFGVRQRSKLLGIEQNSSSFPHLLTMTATPIPRSLALTSYGYLDISTIEDHPRGVKPTKTWLVPEEKRQAGYEWIKKQLKEPFRSSSTSGLTNQAFIICPLVEESEHETLENVKAVTTEFERLKSIFKGFKLGLLHGRMKPQEKDSIISKFRSGELKILVSTPVVEVGIDIPQANIMIIEGAHRFGLASLHQLRGRVGRAGQDSYCLLFTPQKDKTSMARLRALEKYHSGLQLAEIDLKLRGPGEIYGTRQHGIETLKIASLADLELIKLARRAAAETLAELDRYPRLQEKIRKAITEVEPN